MLWNFKLTFPFSLSPLSLRNSQHTCSLSNCSRKFAFWAIGTRYIMFTYVVLLTRMRIRNYPIKQFSQKFLQSRNIFSRRRHNMYLWHKQSYCDILLHTIWHLHCLNASSRISNERFTYYAACAICLIWFSFHTL